MRVLVTGGTGFIGSHTVRALLDAGHQVRLLVRDPAKLERVFGTRARLLGDRVVGEIGDAAAVERALEGCDAVLHAAAMVALEAARARAVLATNARGVELVVGGAHRRGIRSIVYVSSAAALFRPHAPPIRADADVAPARSAYGRSKADAERFVRRLQDAGAPIRTSYPTAVIGPDDPGLSESNHAIQTFLRSLMIVTSSGFQLVDVRDLATLHLRMLEREGGPGRYIAGGHFFSWPEVVDAIERVTGRRVRRVPVPGPWLRLFGRIGDQVKRFVPFDYPLTSESMGFATQWPGADSSATLREFDLAFRDPLVSLADTIAWLSRAGHVEGGRVGRLAEGVS